MDTREVAAVLAKVRAYDNRKVETATVAAWTEALGDLDARDALWAVGEHFRNSTEWLMPAHVRRLALQRAADRAADEAADRAALPQSRPVAPARTTAEVLASLRRTLPPGRPDKVRGWHWLARNPDASREGRM